MGALRCWLRANAPWRRKVIGTRLEWRVGSSCCRPLPVEDFPAVGFGRGMGSLPGVAGRICPAAPCRVFCKPLKLFPIPSIDIFRSPKFPRSVPRSGRGSGGTRSTWLKSRPNSNVSHPEAANMRSVCRSSTWRSARLGAVVVVVILKLLIVSLFRQEPQGVHSRILRLLLPDDPGQGHRGILEDDPLPLPT